MNKTWLFAVPIVMARFSVSSAASPVTVEHIQAILPELRGGRWARIADALSGPPSAALTASLRPLIEDFSASGLPVDKGALEAAIARQSESATQPLLDATAFVHDSIDHPERTIDPTSIIEHHENSQGILNGPRSIYVDERRFHSTDLPLAHRWLEARYPAARKAALLPKVLKTAEEVLKGLSFDSHDDEPTVPPPTGASASRIFTRRITSLARTISRDALRRLDTLDEFHISVHTGERDRGKLSEKWRLLESSIMAVLAERSEEARERLRCVFELARDYSYLHLRFDNGRTPQNLLKKAESRGNRFLRSLFELDIRIGYSIHLCPSTYRHHLSEALILIEKINQSLPQNDDGFPEWKEMEALVRRHSFTGQHLPRSFRPLLAAGLKKYEDFIGGIPKLAAERKPEEATIQELRWLVQLNLVPVDMALVAETLDLLESITPDAQRRIDLKWGIPLFQRQQNITEWTTLQEWLLKYVFQRSTSNIGDNSDRRSRRGFRGIKKQLHDYLSDLNRGADASSSAAEDTRLKIGRIHKLLSKISPPGIY